MDTLASSDTFFFEDFRLDRRRGGLFRCEDAGGFVPIAIGSRALDILGVLIARAGEVVSKDEIVAAVWPWSVVEDSNLTVQISALRRVLDRGRSQGSCIQTVARRGYRFVAAVTQAAAEARSGGSPRPVRVYALRPEALAALPVSSLPPAAPIVQPAAAPRLSIVVLPFANLSSDPEQQYFADGITEDLATDLSRLAHMLVISRNTAFIYRNKPADTKQIGRELNVRYVLEGSIRRSAHRVRVNVQLIDAETDTHLWAERFDHDTDDLFALQDEVTSRIAIALNVELIGAEAARPTEHPEALDYILQGRAAFNKPPSRDKYAESISLYERALALDPRSVEAQSELARSLMARVGFHERLGRCRHHARGGAGRAGLGRITPAARLRISPKVRCCARSGDSRRQFPNMRRRSCSIATGWPH